ncbi:MAG TPA: GNAT family N-acetyltransferase [Candidatus Limnocylindrales bacterium]|nr:GNAT family N-acetyltransferase [Candidatus Limnocylindrales bacterium]
MIFETERLIVREWGDTPGELARIFDIYRRDEVMRWLGGGKVLVNPEQAREVQARWSAYNAEHEGRYGTWAIEVRDTGLLAGTVLLRPMPDPTDGSLSGGEVEIGWHLHPDSFKNGYATEGARGAVGHGFGNGLNEIFAIAKPDNAPSLAVMRRIGMRHLGRTSRWYGIETELYVAIRDLTA